jgi:hypothetical protein
MESAGMAFAIVFTLIVMGFLLVFGYQQITQWFGFQEETQVMKVLKEMEEMARRNFDKSEGSTDIYRVRLPERAGICFVDPTGAKRIYERGKTAQNWDPENPDAVKVMMKNNGYNVFYYTESQAKLEGYKIDILGPAPDGRNVGNFCARNGMSIKFINQGLKVEVQPL